MSIRLFHKMSSGSVLHTAESTGIAKLVVGSVGTVVTLWTLLKDRATKTDLSELRSELKEDVAILQSELKEDVAILRSELKKNVVILRSENKELRSDMKELQADVLKICRNL